MSELRTDFKDDVLDVTQNEKRKYRIIHNDDGTVSLEDATVYLQKGDSFGANDLNEMNRMTNQMNEAAGEILTMADDIDTLQEDVETLESGVASERLLWNINDKIYEDSTELDIASVSGTIQDILFFNDELYVLVSTSTQLILRKWVDNEWNTLFAKSLKYIANGALIEYKGYIYVAVGVELYAYLYKLNGSSTTTIKSVSVSNSRYRIALCKDVENDLLYFGFSNYNGTDYINYVTYDGTNVSSNITTFGNSSFSAYLFDFYIVDNKLYICYQSKEATFYTLAIWDLINNLALGSKRLNQYLSISSKRIGNKIYNIVGANILCELERSNLIEKIDAVRAMCPYGDSLLIYRDPGKFLNVKLYKIATSYATKGTKIYLNDNSFAISDNLEEIDNGYLVTADGEVTIGIYES